MTTLKIEPMGPCYDDGGYRREYRHDPTTRAICPKSAICGYDDCSCIVAHIRTHQCNRDRTDDCPSCVKVSARVTPKNATGVKTSLYASFESAEREMRESYNRDVRPVTGKSPYMYNHGKSMWWNGAAGRERMKITPQKQSGQDLWILTKSWIA